MRSRNTLVLIVLVLVFCVGCGPAFRNSVLNEASSKGWSDKQRKAAAAYAYTYFLAKSMEDGKDKNQDPLSDTENTTSTVSLADVKYNLLSLDRLVTRIDQWLEDFDALLGYSLPEEVKYVDTFGLRKTLAHDEKVMMAVRARVKAAELDRNFKMMLGQLPVEFAMMDCMNGYSIKTIFGAKNPLDVFKFNVDQIDEARKAGTLKQIESCKIKVVRKYDRKEQDPNNLDDNNAYIWRDSDNELEISNYKILLNDNPRDNNGNYVEGFRWNNGKRESRPCLKVFMINGENSNSVMVIDTKKEGDPGFGLPDFVDKEDKPVSANELIHNQELITKLFESRKEHKRVPPKAVPIYVEIARAENPIDVWETATNRVKGFTVPFRYKNAIGSNYNVRIEIARLNIDSVTSESVEAAMSGAIKYFKKEWTNGTQTEPSVGSVVEYYKAKSPYSTMKVMSANVLATLNTKRFVLTLADGSIEMGFIMPGNNKYLEDSPMAIFYTEGEKRYVIKRTAGSKVFDKRKELSTEISDETGVYEESAGLENR